MATALLMLLLFVGLRVLRPAVGRNLLFLPLGVVLAVVLVAQFTMLFGAMEALSMVDDVEANVLLVKEGLEGTVSAAAPQEVLGEIEEQYPLVDMYVKGMGTSGDIAGGTVSAVAGAIRDELSGYIWHRIWWILGAAVVSCIIALILPGTGGCGTCGPSSYDYSGSSMGDTNEWGI